ncbi:Pbp4p NDAI_0D04470 [Naumovozyma dairenensis CBS 421]|uniref:Uncharacterized protein n=1 Tax=Naumovozyma dairenensis (strain ATCC 10597 / BCRC 20456 / CBS 421 / NBRC 0211 / NRRL Y-12639) TaxID=1071378 RepID=G0WAF0_NAUDC|nr:hypothetical protein NDAI_0D04470 [Naumovozyma dairenensis CBS 421]CCD24761.1 hypothetical protein NDAI_0D04470 [Naumovozyma dairenensis CBS 421]
MTNTSTISSKSSTITQKPKSTGWAQATAKSLPKQQETKNTKPKPSSASSNDKSILKTADTDVTESKYKNKKNLAVHREPFNQKTVKAYMDKSFKKYLNDPNVTKYEDITIQIFGTKNSSPDWDTVTSYNKKKNRKNNKYVCLNPLLKKFETISSSK